MRTGADSLLASDRSEAAEYGVARLVAEIGDIEPVGAIREIAGTQLARRSGEAAMVSRLMAVWSDPAPFQARTPRRHLQSFEIASDRMPSRVATRLRDSPLVASVYANPRIETHAMCLGDAPCGDLREVERLLDLETLTARGMDGTGVRLAIVDSGFNADYLRGHGVDANLAGDGHYTPEGVSHEPGKHPVDHGTMCAFDAKIAAPRAQLIDSAALLSRGPGLEAWLEDAIAAYDPLLGGMREEGWPALVLSNSWAISAGSGDLPRGDPGNYSHNPRHLFNQQVRALEEAGADILFAAGNCGAECSPDRCGFGREPSIVGANSLPAVLTVGACNLKGETTGYSSSGPGSLTLRKPDVVAWAHFVGSQVYKADNGTSAACPVAAGVVAAIRSARATDSLSPAELRAAIRRSATPGSFTNESGYGRLDVPTLLTIV